ncbi:MAG: Glycerol-3-phosphate acyltransferase [Armatimonadetes bacterium]|nr:Glycerol-3-phosphate acyltransferase [Armatimonadota bacterium]
MIEGLRAGLPILIGYILGSIPFGYVIVKLMRGIDIREYGSHNIGATNVLRVVGWFPALLTLLGDIGKGVAPPIIATLPVFTGGTINPWLVMLAPLAAICGHAYSAFFYLKERRFARGKAVAAGLGAIIGFVVSGQVAWPGLAIVGAVWALAIVLPKLAQGRWGWVSLASILAACSIPVAFLIVHAKLPYVVFGVLAALFVTWKHKENIGRLLDGVEPRLGEKVPLARVDKDEVACAFLIHAITPEDWWQTRRFSWAAGLYRCGLLPLGVLKKLILLVRPIKSDTIHGITIPDGRTVQVHLVVVPWLPEMIKEHPELAVRRAIQAAEVARDLGARCLGLGAYWSVVGNKGLDVQTAAPFIPITNGGAYTAGTVKQAVPVVLAHLTSRGADPFESTAAVVGANGVVGFGICRQLVGRIGRLIMIGTDLERLERSAALLRRRSGGTTVVVSTELQDCSEAEMIFTATSTVAPVLFEHHVQPGAVIYDLGRPADVDVSVDRVPGVTVIPGGVVRPPGQLRHRLDVHFGPGQIPACMAETILIALDECFERVSLGGDTKSENIDYFVGLAERYGFEVVDDVPTPESLPAVPVPVHA